MHEGEVHFVAERDTWGPQPNETRTRCINSRFLCLRIQVRLMIGLHHRPLATAAQPTWTRRPFPRDSSTCSLKAGRSSRHRRRSYAPENPGARDPWPQGGSPPSGWDRFQRHAIRKGSRFGGACGGTVGSDGLGGILAWLFRVVFPIRKLCTSQPVRDSRPRRRSIGTWSLMHCPICPACRASPRRRKGK